MMRDVAVAGVRDNNLHGPAPSQLFQITICTDRAKWRASASAVSGTASGMLRRALEINALNEPSRNFAITIYAYQTVRYAVASHYYKKLFCENSDVRGFL